MTTASPRNGQLFRPRRVIASGSFSTVRLHEDAVGNIRVVKQILSANHTDSVQAARLEALELVSDHQEFFVGLYGWHESGGSLFIALQYVEHGDLYNHMKSAEVAQSAKEITRQVLTGLATLHEKNICHGDLHPSNIYLSSLAPVRIKMANFGFLKPLESTEHTAYLAPERFSIVRASRSEPVDMWAVGCLIYELLTSTLPFQCTAEDDASAVTQLDLTMLSLFCAGRISLPIDGLEQCREDITDGAMYLVQRLLVADPDSRWSASMALQSKWFDQLDTVMGNVPDDLPISTPTSPSQPLQSGSDPTIFQDSVTPDAPDTPLNTSGIGELERATSLLALGAQIPHPRAPPGPEDLLNAASIGDLATARSLLSRGANTKHTNRKGRTALLLAAYHGHTELVQLLLIAGARVTERDNNGNTPLLLAATTGHTATISLLLRSGARIAEQDLQDATALLLAAYHGHADTVRFLLAHGASTAEADTTGSSALLKAAYNGHVGTMAALRDHGADTRKRNRDGDTALSLAAAQGHRACVLFLLDRGVAVDRSSYDGYTPLLKAAANGHTEVARLLLLRGADAERKARDGGVVDVAEGNEHYDTARELRAHIRGQESRRRSGRRARAAR